MQKLTSSFAINGAHCAESRPLPLWLADGSSAPSVVRWSGGHATIARYAWFPSYRLHGSYGVVEVGQQQFPGHMLRAELSASACSKPFPRMHLLDYGVPPGP